VDGLGYDGCTPVESLLLDSVDALILDFLEWLAPEPKAYAEVMDAWRTSCPRFPVWEDANERGFVERRYQEGVGTFICVTMVGREFLHKHRSCRLSSP
jgi:hypothetical protein